MRKTAEEEDIIKKAANAKILFTKSHPKLSAENEKNVKQKH